MTLILIKKIDTTPSSWSDKNPIDNNSQNTLPPRSKTLKYEVIDFGDEASNEMSKILDIDRVKILINSKNKKFKMADKQVDPLYLALHISECFIKEINGFKNPSITTSQLMKKFLCFMITISIK